MSDQLPDDTDAQPDGSDAVDSTAITSPYTVLGQFDAGGAALAAIRALSDRLAENGERIDDQAERPDARERPLGALEAGFDSDPGGTPANARGD